MNATTRCGRLCRDTDPVDTEPAPPPWEADTWPSPGHDDTDWRPGLPTDPAPSGHGLSALEERAALRHSPLPAEYYELVGEEEVAR